MKVPRLTWRRRHNVAVITVSYARRVWTTRELGKLVLGYNATGRLSRVVVLDPETILGDEATVAQAISRVIEYLLREGLIRQGDLDVLISAFNRADPPEPSCRV